jgi:hypothetical protein
MAGRIRDAVAVSADQERGDVQKLTGREHLYRLRVGDWRIIFTVEEGGHLNGDTPRAESAGRLPLIDPSSACLSRHRAAP